MKSVGEVMGIGRSFQEALHKATQSLEIKRNGLGADGKGYTEYDLILKKLAQASWDRVFVIVIFMNEDVLFYLLTNSLLYIPGQF